MKKIYVFLGLPASGKGTQAQLFAKKHNLTTLSIGELVREKIRANKEDTITKRVKEQYNAGQAVDDKIVFSLIEEKIVKVKNGLVFDNFPFTLGQLDFFKKTFTKRNGWNTPELFYIKIDPKSAIKRISTRRICPGCKKIFSDIRKDCDVCNIKLETRPDDNPETLKKRINIYQPKINTIIEKYKKIGPIYEINGDVSIPSVTAEINAIK